MEFHPIAILQITSSNVCLIKVPSVTWPICQSKTMKNRPWVLETVLSVPTNFKLIKTHWDTGTLLATQCGPD